MRMFLFAAVSLALLAAVALYAVSLETRQLADTNQLMEREIRTLERDIAILRAERAYLSRADRIEPLARQLGMRPIKGGQHMVGGELEARLRKAD